MMAGHWPPGERNGRAWVLRTICMVPAHHHMRMQLHMYFRLPGVTPMIQDVWNDGGEGKDEVSGVY